MKNLNDILDKPLIKCFNYILFEKVRNNNIDYSNYIQLRDAIRDMIGVEIREQINNGK